jgi:hypothetical protein
MFEDLARFVTAHRGCGELVGDVGEISKGGGYTFRIVCSCGASFERWVTPEIADEDLLRSRLLAFPGQNVMIACARLMLAATRLPAPGGNP